MASVAKVIFINLVVYDLYLHLYHAAGLPVVHIDQLNYHISYGENFTINCTIEADPPITDLFYIKSDGKQIITLNAGLPGTIGMTLNVPSLTITYTTEYDAGLYSCYAINRIGKGNSNTVLVTVKGGVPSITISNRNYTVLYGESVTLTCIIDAYPSVSDVHWKRNSSGYVTILSSGSVGVSGTNQTHPSLILNSATSSDSGTYVCIASNIAGTQQSEESTLVVNGGIPTVTGNHTLYIVPYGSSVVLDCAISAKPSLTNIYWKQQVENTQSIVYAGESGTSGATLNNPSLTIHFATLPDSGYYRCFGTNVAGTSNGPQINLIVTGDQPQVTVGSSSYTSIAGATITLECDVISNPEVILVYWESSSSGLLTTINANAVGTNGSTTVTPSLTFKSADKSDTGLYTCFAVNALGTGFSNTIQLTVTGSKPIVTVDSLNKTVEYGSEVTLNCHVISSPEHTLVYWQKSSNGTITSLFGRLPGVLGVTLDNPSLTIEYITREDIGIYTCFAKNSLGTGRSNDTVDIDLIAGAPKITVKKLNYTAFGGKSVQLLCSVHSNPQHNTVFWERNVNGTTTTILAGMIAIRGVTVDNPSLTIEYVTKEMAGEYRCFATNEIGTSASEAIQLEVLQ